ncbi:hypothetical protein FQ330_03040 [Agrococcus sediminis]|uniref:DUF4395 domain-containing protein n=1 Tax=Agrococcus sediminis TaxID=2599924 RepID=A0A5M8QJX7_9MICO|nr:hypothetical protein [Agrococcus sediminis]KAA6436395.1 hypothetical protein FQ330_03040 [Agrococcus sediminis]
MTTAGPADAPRIGRHLPGYAVPVVDERAVRAAAGLLLLAGGIAFGLAAATGSQAPLQPFGVLGAPLWVTLALCALCLGMLFAETAFGICVGCALQRAFGTTPPQHCPGGVCAAS